MDIAAWGWRRAHTLATSESVWLVGMRGGFGVIAFATLLVLQKAMAGDEFGLFVTINAFVTIFLSLARAGFGKIVVREAQRDDPDLANGLVKGLLLWSAAVLVGFVAFVGFYLGWARHDALVLFVCWAVAMYALNLGSTLLLSAHERIRARIVLFTVYPVIVLAAVVVLSLAGPVTMDRLIAVYGGAGAVGALLTGVHVLRRTPFRPAGVWAARARFHRDSLGLGVANLLNAFAATLPVIYLSSFVDRELAGEFRLVTRAAEFILIFPQLLENVGEPEIYRNAVQQARAHLARSVARLHGRMILAAVAGMIGIVAVLNLLAAWDLVPNLFREPGFYLVAVFCLAAAWVGPGVSVSTAFSQQRVLIAAVVVGLAMFFAIAGAVAGQLGLETAAFAYGLLVLSTKLIPAAYVRWKGYVPRLMLPRFGR